MKHVLAGQGITLIEGPNFSGRSHYLKALVRKDVRRAQAVSCRSDRSSSYIGIDAHHYLSGLIPTVSGELALHGFRNHVRHTEAVELLKSGNLTPDSIQNPLTLSGGQQVALSLATSVLATRNLLAIDCSLEQLSPDARQRVTEVLQGADLGMASILADNRIGEYRTNLRTAAVILRERAGVRTVPNDISVVPIDTRNDAERIVLSKIHFGYRRCRPVFTGLDFVFEPGNVYCIEGDNGIGKSTLAKLLCGLIRPVRGQLSCGRTAKWKPWLQPGAIVAYHFQNPDLQLLSSPAADQLANAHRPIAESLGLGAFLDGHPYDLPFVLKKRLALAITLGRSKSWLVLDEPVLGQDTANGVALAKAFDGLAAAGLGVIVITHSSWLRAQFGHPRILRLTSHGLAEV